MRVSISKSKNAELLYIIKDIKKNGKRTSKTIERLGNIETLKNELATDREGVMAWANERAKELTRQEKNNERHVIIKYSPSQLIEKDHQRFFIGGYIFLKQILHELKLDKVCRHIASDYQFKFDLTDILATLIYTRILSPSSKKSSFEIASSYLEAPRFDIQHIYRALDIIAKEKNTLQTFVYRSSSNIVKRHTGVLYFDCTNFFFEMDEEDELKRYGQSKENRPNPLVQMGMFLDGNGIPLSFCINPGNTNEQTTLIPLEAQMLKDFDISKCVVCTDAGVASTNNRLFNTLGRRSFIVTQSIKKLKAYLKEWALADTGWSLPATRTTPATHDLVLSDLDEKDQTTFEKIYYKERWYIEGGLEQRLIVSYSPKYKAYQRKIRDKQIERAQVMIHNGVKRKGKNQNDPARFITETNTTPAGEIAEEIYRTLDITKIHEEEKYDGFYAVCTTLTDEVSEVIKVNQRRWEIEESFRIMKSEFKSRPVYLSRNDRVIAHFTTCFLSLLVYRLLEQKLQEKYTVCQIISTLQSMNFLHHEGEGYIPTYTRTDLTDDLHELLGHRTDTQIVTEKKMKKILKMIKL